MRRILKLFAAFVVVLIVALIIVVVLLPTERIAAIAVAQVKEATGRDLHFSGDISPSFYPVLGVQTEGVTLSNADWAEGENMISASSAKVGVELIPLLSGSVRITEVRLVDPQILLEVSASGKKNWEFGDGQTATTTTETTESDEEGFVKEISLGETVIENGSVRYLDRLGGQTIELKNIDAIVALPALDQEMRINGKALWNDQDTELALTLSTPETLMAGGETSVALSLASEPVSMTFSGAFAPPADGGMPEASGEYSFAASDPAAAIQWATGGKAPEGLVGLSDVKIAGKIALDSTALAATLAGGATRDGERAAIDLKVDSGADWATARKFAVDLAAEIGSMAKFTYAGEAAAPDGASPSINGKYQIAVSDPAGVAKWATGDGSSLQGLSDIAFAGVVSSNQQGLSFTGAGGLARDGRQIDLDIKARGGADWMAKRAFTLALKANSAGLISLDFAGDASAPANASPAIDGHLSLDAPDLRSLAAFAGAELPEMGPDALRSLSFKGSISTPSTDQIKVAISKLTFDTITASGSLSAIMGNVTTVNANLNAGDIDLTPYITETDEAGETGWSKEPIDLAGLGAVNGHFQIRAKSVKAPNLTLGQSDIDARLTNGALRLQIQELGLYGGGLKGDIHVDGRNGNALSADISANTVGLLPMLRDMAGLDMLEGLGATKVKVAGKGASMHDIMNSLNGAGSFSLTEGALVGFNLAGMVRNVQNALTGGDSGDARTDFSEVSATFDINGGVLNNADFKFLGPLIRIVGAGDIDLGGQAMNFRLTPKAVTSLKGQGGALDATGLAFPLIIKGPWNDLSIRPDLKSGIADILKNPEGAVKAVEDIVKGVSGDGVGGAAKKVLESVTDGGSAKKLLEGVTGGGSGGDNGAAGQVLDKVLGGGGDDKTKDGAKKLLKGLFGNN
ncbi:MAG: AsmA family protein [Pikeienuella sp.]